MLVNASHHPGPALWQGLMLLLLPVVLFGLVWRDGRYLPYFMAAYLGVGVVMFAAIIWAGVS